MIAILSNPDHPFSQILSSWDKSKAPIGMFWRHGSWRDSTWFNYLVSSSMKDLSEKDLYKNLQKSEMVVDYFRDSYPWRLFVLIFEEPKLGIEDKSPRKKTRV